LLYGLCFESLTCSSSSASGYDYHPYLRRQPITFNPLKIGVSIQIDIHVFLKDSPLSLKDV
jgi:hypothetical protein